MIWKCEHDILQNQQCSEKRYFPFLLKKNSKIKMYCDDWHTKEQKNLHQNVNKLLPRGGIVGGNFTVFKNTNTTSWDMPKTQWRVPGKHSCTTVHHAPASPPKPRPSILCCPRGCVCSRWRDGHPLPSLHTSSHWSGNPEISHTPHACEGLTI